MTAAGKGLAGEPAAALAPSRLRARDSLRVAAAGLRARPLRVVLSALGIAVGIAAMVAVVGISASSREQVNERLRELGTNLLTVTPGQSFTGEPAELPAESVTMVDRMPAVHAVSAVGTVSDAAVYRNDRIDEAETNALAVSAARTDLLATVGGTVAAGRWLDDALGSYPAVVLGSRAAELLGVSHARVAGAGGDGGSVDVWLGGEWFTVVGVLDPVPLAPELDSSALIGWRAAEDLAGAEVPPSTVYERSDEAAVEEVAALLPATVNPANPAEVSVSRPSDALAAQQAADETLTTLLLALGGVALLVGGIGVANTMVIAVLERRSEIGLRRALGATRAHIRRQFLGESVLLAALGGAGGALLGGAVTAAFAAGRGWPFALPGWVLAAAAGATVLVGALAGAYPAGRAARMPPTAALSTG